MMTVIFFTILWMMSGTTRNLTKKLAQIAEKIFVLGKMNKTRALLSASTVTSMSTFNPATRGTALSFVYFPPLRIALQTASSCVLFVTV